MGTTSYHVAMSERSACPGWLRRFKFVACTAVVALAVSTCSGKPASQQAQELLTKGLQAHASGRLDEAARYYREVLAKEPNNEWAHYNLGQIAQTRGDLPTAETEYRTALNQDPKLEFALFNLAIVRTKLGAKTEALDLYRRALALNANNANTHLNLGFLLIELKQNAEGEKELRKAVSLDPALAARLPRGITIFK
jgi:Tfp pilus assembly protein PilF